VFSTVKSELQSYADRGIFQNFSVAEDEAGNTAEFRFNWLSEAPFQLKLNTAKSELELKNILPAVPYRSDMDRAYRQFLTERCDASLPAHRRLDSERFSFQCKNRQAKLSVIIGFSENDGGEAARTAINLLHETFNNFLMEGPYQNYMVEVFNVPEE
jgi:hypothetical protein